MGKAITNYRTSRGGLKNTATHRRILSLIGTNFKRESAAHYMTELRHAADNCDFGGITTSQIICDRFVHGLRDATVRERLLRENDLTLERSYEMVQAAEATAVQTHIMAGDQAVCTVQAPNRFRGRDQIHKDEMKAERMRKILFVTISTHTFIQ